MEDRNELKINPLQCHGPGPYDLSGPLVLSAGYVSWHQWGLTRQLGSPSKRKKDGGLKYVPMHAHPHVQYTPLYCVGA